MSSTHTGKNMTLSGCQENASMYQNIVNPQMILMNLNFQKFLFREFSCNFKPQQSLYMCTIMCSNCLVSKILCVIKLEMHENWNLAVLIPRDNNLKLFKVFFHLYGTLLTNGELVWIFKIIGVNAWERMISYTLQTLLSNAMWPWPLTLKSWA